MSYYATTFKPRPTRTGHLAPAGWGHRHDVDLDGLRSATTHFRPATDKARVNLWSPSRFEGNRRRAEHAEAACALVFDVDGGATLDDVEQWADGIGCMWWLHTSWSHSPTGDHKCRLILPLMTECPAEYYPRLWLKYAPGFADPQAKDISRAFYLPSGDPSRFEVRGELDRPLLDVNYIGLPLTPAEEKRREYRERVDGTPINRLNVRDPRVREAIAIANGADIVNRSEGPIAKGMTCQMCGQRDAWYPIFPTKVLGVMCNHINSCGHIGSLSTYPAPTL